VRLKKKDADGVDKREVKREEAIEARKEKEGRGKKRRSHALR
jgi:hypothetical protein